MDGTLRREVRLTADRPFSRKMQLRLIAVKPDGTVRFSCGSNVHELRPGDRAPTALGPWVIRADPAAQLAVVAVTDSESFRIYTLGSLSVRVPDTAPTPVDVIWSPLTTTAWLLRGAPRS
jgi:hypothetical protein